ncbi:hypothetical protein C8F04DRAFT_1173447 [Mycena alexandri]|uniref:Uncharacterized protein n=1 Tax=Mycena alexandri TaxID=1745969 RepID=A0AAD6TEZ9_9AGAR|nr:hypothetical protein C8F04DRAFT_1173447 [Mycena alexandri]
MNAGGTYSAAARAWNLRRRSSSAVGFAGRAALACGVVELRPRVLDDAAALDDALAVEGLRLLIAGCARSAALLTGGDRTREPSFWTREYTGAARLGMKVTMGWGVATAPKRGACWAGMAAKRRAIKGQQLKRPVPSSPPAMSTVMQSPSPFPLECRPILSALRRATTFNEDSVPNYFYFSEIGAPSFPDARNTGFAAFHESLGLLGPFAREYPLGQRTQVRDTADFLRARARLLASLAAIYAVAGFRDRIRLAAVKAARADVDAALELMTDEFVDAWGPSRVRGARARRQQALMVVARREDRAAAQQAYWATRLAAVEAPVPALSADDGDDVAAGTSNNATVGTGTTTTVGMGWGTDTMTNTWGTGWGTGWGWGWVPHRRQRRAPRVWPLRSWSRHMGRTARPPARYGPRRRRMRVGPPTFDEPFMRRLTALLARLGRRVLARSLVE